MTPIAAALPIVIFAASVADVPTPTRIVTVTIAGPDRLGSAVVHQMIAEAGAIWQPAGVTLQVREPNTPDRAGVGSDVTITFDAASRPAGAYTAPLGWVRFDRVAGPESVIHLSIANAENLLERSGAMRDKPMLWHDVLIARAMGRALAHELGHYLLQSPEHAPQGLMRAVRPSADFFNPSRKGFELAFDPHDLLDAGVRRVRDDARRRACAADEPMR